MGDLQVLDPPDLGGIKAEIKPVPKENAYLLLFLNLSKFGITVVKDMLEICLKFFCLIFYRLDLDPDTCGG